jgi:hypothetical protein
MFPAGLRLMTRLTAQHTSKGAGGAHTAPAEPLSLSLQCYYSMEMRSEKRAAAARKAVAHYGINNWNGGHQVRVELGGH